MLSFEHKKSILKSFDELEEVPRSHERVNFVYSDSKKRAKVVVRELHPSGNGYVCGRYMAGYRTDARGWINIKGFDEEQLRDIIHNAIGSMKKA